MGKLSANEEGLIESVKTIILSAKNKVAVYVNAELTMLYWAIGTHINNYILEGNRAEYNKSIIKNLAEALTLEFGKGWSEKQLRHCLRVAESFVQDTIVSAVQRQLSWTHIKIIAYEKDELKRQFYLEMAATHKWSTRQLSEQIDKMLYERTALAQKPAAQIQQAIKDLSNDIIQADVVFKSSYVLDFLGLKNTFSEKELEDALISQIQAFIMELGKGFTFVERQKRVSVDATDYYLDLLFYHRKLKRLVAIDLKLGKFKPTYKAQMELYLKWLDKYEKEKGEEKPIGLILCSEGNTEHVELLLLDQEDIKVAQYLLEFPSKEWFSQKLKRAVAIAQQLNDDNNKS